MPSPQGLGQGQTNSPTLSQQCMLGMLNEAGRVSGVHIIDFSVFMETVKEQVLGHEGATAQHIQFDTHIPKGF